MSYDFLERDCLPCSSKFHFCIVVAKEYFCRFLDVQRFLYHWTMLVQEKWVPESWKYCTLSFIQQFDERFEAWWCIFVHINNAFIIYDVFVCRITNHILPPPPTPLHMLMKKSVKWDMNFIFFNNFVLLCVIVIVKFQFHIKRFRQKNCWYCFTDNTEDKWNKMNVERTSFHTSMHLNTRL